jgi:hypothetical protein
LHVFPSDKRTCRHCGAEYTEAENFNWSCRTHQSEFGAGEIWWCCGKLGKDAIGCRFRKHVYKDDDVDDDEEGGNNEDEESEEEENVDFMRDFLFFRRVKAKQVQNRKLL